MEGSIQTRSWEDDDGNKRYATEVVVDNVEFAQSKGEGNGRTGDIKQGNKTLTENIDGFIPTDYEEDLPFDI